MLQELLQGTRLIDVVIAITVAETAALLLYRLGTGRGLAPRDFLYNLFSGLMLMLALRSTMVSDGGAWVAAFLAMAGAAHVADMWRRWRRQAPPFRRG